MGRFGSPQDMVLIWLGLWERVQGDAWFLTRVTNWGSAPRDNRMRNWFAGAGDEFTSGHVRFEVPANQSFSFSSVFWKMSCSVPVKYLEETNSLGAMAFASPKKLTFWCYSFTLTTDTYVSPQHSWKMHSNHPFDNSTWLRIIKIEKLGWQWPLRNHFSSNCTPSALLFFSREDQGFDWGRRGAARRWLWLAPWDRGGCGGSLKTLTVGLLIF